jgi:hypothetical protein
MTLTGGSPTPYPAVNLRLVNTNKTIGRCYHTCIVTSTVHCRLEEAAAL